jgi:hypothetical protein
MKDTLYVYAIHVWAKQGHLQAIKDTHNQGSGTPSEAQSGRNTKDRNIKHPVTPKLIIIMTYFKSTI